MVPRRPILGVHRGTRAAVADATESPFTFARKFRNETADISAFSDARLSATVLAPGDTLAFTRLSAAGVNDLYVVSMAGGDPQRLTFDNRLIGGRGWTPDGEEIVFSSNRGGNFRLWRVPAQGGEPKPLAIGGENAQNLSISQEGHLLAYTQRLVDENLWRMSGPRSPVKTGPTQLVALTQRTTEVDYDPEGDRIAFVAGYGVHSDIWVGDSDGSNLVQLTTLGRFTGRPCWSPDGREIVFTSRPEEHSNLYVVDVQTGQVRQLTSDPVNDRRPSWSRDGKSIYFGSDRSGSAQIWKIPSQGGQAAQVTQNGGWLAFESPDGKLLHYSKVGLGVYRIALGGGQEEKIELPPGAGDFWIWEGSILYERDRSLELLDLSTNKTTLLGTTDRDPDNPRISPDGRWISYSQIDQSKADIMLVENFR